MSAGRPLRPRRRIAPGLLRAGRRVRAFLFPPPLEQEVDEELAFHVRMRVRELVAAGWDEAAAREEAARRLGDLESVREACLELGREREARMKIRDLWQEAMRDAAYGLRQLRRQPAFAAVTVLTLALGIGANTAVFSVVRGVLLRPLPYENPDELVSLWTRYLPTTGLDIPQFVLSGPELVDYRDASRAMEDVVPWQTTSRTVTGEGGEPERIPAGLAGEGLFELLGVRPFLGRDFVPADQASGAAPTVILSHGLWTERFGADPDVVGRSITVEGESAQVVGVMGPDFVFPNARIRFWEPIRFDEATMPGRGAHYLAALARLADGTTLEAAEAELETITAAWYQEYEHHASGHFIYLVPFREDVVGDAAGTILVLMGAVALVLLVACGNVANLFLARSEARQREMAVRTALGAGRWRLSRQLLAESLSLAGVGGALGLLLAWWATPAVLAIDPSALPRAEGIRVDRTVLAFTLAVTVAATLLFGLVPALQTSGRAPAGALSGGRGSADDPRRRTLRRVLIAGQVALSVLVVLAAGLTVRSFRTLSAQDPGVETTDAVVFDLALPPAAYPAAQDVAVAYRVLQERLQGLPGVVAASAVSDLPLDGTASRSDFLPEGEAPPADGVPAWNAFTSWALPGYFETAGVPVLAGRPLAATDDADSEAVVVVSRALVERYWPGAPYDEVLGRRISFDFFADEPVWLRIVGVMGDVRADMAMEPEPQTYVALAQIGLLGGTGRQMTAMVRTSAPVATVVPGLRRAVAEVDPRLPLANLRTMEDVTRRSVARPRLTASLLSAFGALALLLAAVGVYGVVSWSVTRRTREIGVRLALGAGRGRLMAMMVLEGGLPAAVGAGLGVLAALAGAGLLGDVLYGVSPWDPSSFAILPLGLLAVASLAAWLPARRATRIPATEALREG